MRMLDAPPRQFPWFRSRAGRRYSLELAAILLAKLVALSIVYFAFVAPQPRADTSPRAMQQHLLDAAPATHPGNSP